MNLDSFPWQYTLQRFGLLHFSIALILILLYSIYFSKLACVPVGFLVFPFVPSFTLLIYLFSNIVFSLFSIADISALSFSIIIGLSLLVAPRLFLSIHFVDKIPLIPSLAINSPFIRLASFYIFCYAILALVGSSVSVINTDAVILLRFSGNFFAKLITIFTTCLIYIVLFNLCRALVSNNYSISIVHYFIFLSAIFCLFSISVSEGSKSSLSSFFVSCWCLYPIISFYLLRFFRLLRRFRLSLNFLFAIIISSLLILSATAYSGLLDILVWLLVYYFAGPIECISAISFSNVTLTNLTGLQYYQTLLEPLHVFGLASKLSIGTTINNSLAVLPDSELGGTNDSLFCWSYGASLFSLFPLIAIGSLSILVAFYSFQAIYKFVSLRSVSLSPLVLFALVAGVPIGSWANFFVRLLYAALSVILITYLTRLRLSNL